jgi:GT2 family glycosyltransferase
MKLYVLLTSHNRKEKTLESLEKLFAQSALGAISTTTLLVDDGSSDGTRDAVQVRFPSVQIWTGNGDLYWCGGMRKAFVQAVKSDPDFYLWLNDDTLLYADALSRLLACHSVLVAQGENRPIIVGATQDPETREATYGGVKRSGGWHPLDHRLVLPTSIPQQCETFNGNCVLVSRAVAHRLGNLDAAFTHGMGDTDYGLRAGKAGCTVWVAPGFAGTCSRNATLGSWRDPSLPLTERLRKIMSRKGLPPREWATLVRRHGGSFWPLYWASPYLNILKSSFLSVFREKPKLPDGKNAF